MKVKRNPKIILKESDMNKILNITFTKAKKGDYFVFIDNSKGHKYSFDDVGYFRGSLKDIVNKHKDIPNIVIENIVGNCKYEGLKFLTYSTAYVHGDYVLCFINTQRTYRGN